MVRKESRQNTSCTLRCAACIQRRSCVAAAVNWQDLIAVKQLSLRNADQAEELYTEIELMRQLTHPNIVCYLGAEVTESTQRS